MENISLKVNEKEVPLNELMQDMLKNLVLGYLKSAKKIPEEIKAIKIEINL
jgi:hypothetical protein